MPALQKEKPRRKRGGLLNKKSILQRYLDRQEIFGSVFKREGPSFSKGKSKKQATPGKKGKSKSSKLVKNDSRANVLFS